MPFELTVAVPVEPPFDVVVRDEEASFHPLYTRTNLLDPPTPDDVPWGAHVRAFGRLLVFLGPLVKSTWLQLQPEGRALLQVTTRLWRLAPDEQESQRLQAAFIRRRFDAYLAEERVDDR